MPLDQTRPPRPATPPLPAYAKTRFRSLLKPRRRRREKPFALTPAEQILHHIFNNADFIAAHRTTGHRGFPTDVIHLLLSLDAYDFQKLCIVGAELEDAEASVGEDDRESDGLDTPPCQPGEGYELDNGEGPDCDDEPSLGMPDGMMNQERAAKTCAGHDADLEQDRCDDEPDHDNEPDERDYPIAFADGGAKLFEEEPRPRCIGDFPKPVLDLTGIARKVERGTP